MFLHLQIESHCRSSVMQARSWRESKIDWRSSLLAFRTPEGGASILGKSPHKSLATCGLAFFAFAIVDLKRVLEITELAGGLAMIAQRRAAGRDGLVEHRVNSRDQTLRMIGRLTLFAGQRRG